MKPEEARRIRLRCLELSTDIHKQKAGKYADSYVEDLIIEYAEEMAQYALTGKLNCQEGM